MKKQGLEYRMYGLVNYQICNTIHAGIQFGHAVVEYSNKFLKKLDYQKWSKKDKTFIILNGGTTNLKSHSLGTLNKHLQTLNDMGVHIAKFYEPDLGDQLTAVVFLVDERVFNEEKYPEPNEEDMYEGEWTKGISKKELNRIFLLRNFLKPLKLA